ncbi:MAG: hypothetical protein PHD15_06215 [Clostridia bacterium]|nr:hypothetical protein [Clostridia bacterium]MDD4387324.1 hypothetical protein [Clostridia bacterium]
MKKKNGISLIVLVITIIVIIILAGAVILSLANNNPIEQANEALFKTNVDEYNSELTLAISNQYLQDQSFDPTIFDKEVWNGGTIGETIKKYIPSITVADGLKFEIQDSKLVYVGTNETEQEWFTSMSMTSEEETGLGLDVIATDNITFNGEAAAYNNPIIPKGFKAINTTDASWVNLSTDWNTGLVIEDTSGNQFVWVPVDGTNVPYAKWCTTNIAWNHADISDDTVVGVTNEAAQVTKYGGFYIARYEAMFDFNGGALRVASKPSTNKTTTDWRATRTEAYNGYLWNYINYTDAKSYAENMDTHYAYDTSKVITTLVSGTQWDTVLKWIQNSGKSVIDSRTWGNYSDSIFPANVAGFASLQISGFSENWKANNIYNIAGNTLKWTSEIYSSSRVFRGGSFFHSGSSGPAAYRSYDPVTNVRNNLAFRPSLYIL